jgi:hypothetical protein
LLFPASNLAVSFFCFTRLCRTCEYFFAAFHRFFCRKKRYFCAAKIGRKFWGGDPDGLCGRDTGVPDGTPGAV